MKRTLFITVVLTIFSFGCGSGATNTSKPANAANNANVEATAAKTPADGFFQGKGKVTKINNDLGTVELDHEAIPELMPAMKMEFYVKDKAILKPITVGDDVSFTLEYKQGTEKIVAIGK